MSNFIRHGTIGLTMLVLVLLAVACGDADKNAYQPTLRPADPLEKPSYVVGIHPLHNPQRLMELYGPIMDFLNQQIPQVRITLETSRNYEEFERKLYAGDFAFAMPNPYQTVLSRKHGYRIFGKMADDEEFRGIILLRKDSGIREVADLKGKIVAYPAKTALAATLMPQYYLHTHGIDVNTDVVNRYVGSQESSIENVLHGHSDAAATWPGPWKLFQANNPEEASKLQLKWQTATLPSNGWVVRQDVPAPVSEAFARVLLHLHESAQGRALLSRLPVSRFEPADEKTYEPVRNFLVKYSTTIHPIEY